VPDLKSLRKRIGSVKNTQKITRAQKMVAGARLSRAQHRIQAMRPYAVQTASVLAEVVGRAAETEAEGDAGHPLLARRPDKNTLILVVSADRGLCGSVNSNINKAAERLWRERTAAGGTVQFAIVGRKARDFLKRRKAPTLHVFEHVWDKLGVDQARDIARVVLKPFRAGQVDSIQILFTQFKSAMTQTATLSPLFPLSTAIVANKGPHQEATHGEVEALPSFSFEPSRGALLEQLVPMYIEITILRALYESVASELGARMTAMDSATKKASELIDELTLRYNRARQAAITTEIMEIIGGAEALNG
jgi:F-type H+-transporting ATPase subunit gamma